MVFLVIFKPLVGTGHRLWSSIIKAETVEKDGRGEGDISKKLFSNWWTELI